MAIRDLVLLFSVFVILVGLLSLLVALAARQRHLALRIGLSLLVYTAVYAILLAGFSLLTPQRVLSMHQIRCFDDWCTSVEQVVQQPVIGTVRARGSFYLVTLQISSQARRISQRARDVSVYLLDEHRVHYDPDPAGQHTLEAAGMAGQPLDGLLAPGGSFTSTVVFDLPPGITRPGLVISHGAFPGRIIIGDDQSFLHKPTIVQLSPP